ncbi:winged helix-turn-helix domain-containing protein [Halobacteriaceae archaeon SHR40]|uniref:ArsR/SmtB family transcription factor n=1 Tax=Halovenus amylolytica TaxID=2500550 RepID=UPI000FE3611F
MSSIFPLRDTVRPDESREPRLVDLDEETADEVFETLAATTTRKIFLSLHEEPQTASDLAEVTDTSVQNVQYHLEKLQDAELVSVVDTWYSERGSEMQVYAPDDESLVLYAGRDKQSTFRSILNRMLGLASFLVPTSVLAGWAARQTVQRGSDPSSGAAAGDPEQVEVETREMGEEGTEEVGSNTGDIGPQSTADANTTGSGNETDGVEFVIDGNQTDPVLITDGGNVTVLPEEAVSASTESTATIDPALVGGIAFLCGAIVVILALWAWYGTPD